MSWLLRMTHGCYMDQPPIKVILENLGVPHRVFRHEMPVTSLEQAARERGQRPGQIVRSILFRVRDGEYALALVAGEAQVSWKRLRRVLGRSRISMATEQEVLEVTGYRIGTVGPFGLRRPVRILVEAGVLLEEQISMGSGMRDRAIILKSADLVKALGEVEIVNLFDGDP
ncbi:MAG: YbaK/EbsC family protein [Chloroflexi bacterium]|nr:YbaK/EbsC family protein [Chloroflexota bacterium]